VRVFAFLCLVFEAAGQVTTSQYDNARTGANLHETVLTPQNVNARQFGKIFSFRVDGDIYAQPLYLPAVEIPGKGVHNVLFIATEHDSVYAFDADGKTTEPLWHVNFLTPGAHTVSASDVQCPFITPEIGITPTPAIDLPTGTLYVLARTKEGRGALSGNRFVQRLHALAITTGVEKFGGPTEIKASGFDPLRELPRAGLLLANDQVYLTWASSCDVPTYHGWVMSYDAHTLAQTTAFNTSPDAEESGTWQGDAAPAADEQGNVFVVTGNGKFDAAPTGRDYGDSVLKLGRGLQVADYFTPHDQARLNAADADLGSGGPVLLPGHLLLVGGKGGVLYVLDRDHLGKYRPDDARDGLDTVRLHDMFGAPAYWNGHVYVQASNDVLKDFSLDHGKLVGPVASGTQRFIDPGATPAISANGSRNGIVWILESKGWRSPDRPAVLHAYDAANVAREIYNSEQVSGRDRAGKCLRFAVPTVVNGRVYVGAKSEVDVYGLLPAAPAK